MTAGRIEGLIDFPATRALIPAFRALNSGNAFNVAVSSFIDGIAQRSLRKQGGAKCAALQSVGRKKVLARKR